tara:strand:- start:2162 stop:2908 length:747 start_codon:yes stop_codon:yes gene_type:complete
MFSKKIEFISLKDYVDLKEDHPIPIKLNIPEWYKKLIHTHDRKTVKGCMPFLDSMTAGYLMKVPQDININHNVLNEETGQLDSFYHVMDLDSALMHAKGINLLKPMPDVHPTQQVEGSPHLEKNKNLPLMKFSNPWRIKTPPGYSCLFLPPMNNQDDRFSVIPGIVDTDTYNIEINFPFVMNGDKYPTLKTTIEKGTPMVQVIPFKRDSWKMEIKGVSTEKMREPGLFYHLRSIHIYKNKYWNKKKWN